MIAVAFKHYTAEVDFLKSAESWIFSKQLGSDFVHTELVFLDYGVGFSAWSDSGVTFKPLYNRISNINGWEFYELKPRNVDKLWDWCISQKGKAYDKKAILGLVNNKNQHDTTKWFCSEIAYYAITVIDHQDFPLVQPHKVFPGDLRTMCIQANLKQIYPSYDSLRMV